MCCFLAVQLQYFAIGITTQSPDTEPRPKGWADIDDTGQYWHVAVGNDHCTAWHKGNERLHPWPLDDSIGSTFACQVSENGNLHLYHNGWDVGVALEGLPKDQPLWGFVRLRGGWKVEASYVIPKGEAIMCDEVVWCQLQHLYMFVSLLVLSSSHGCYVKVTGIIRIGPYIDRLRTWV